LIYAPTDISTLVGELAAGNEKATAELVVLLYSELRNLASRYLQRERSHHTLQTTALVHEAYVRLAGQREVRWKNREQFVGVAAQLMRRILVDYSRGHGAQKRGKEFEKVFLEEAEAVSHGKASDVIALDEALTRLAEPIGVPPLAAFCAINSKPCVRVTVRNCSPAENVGRQTLKIGGA
jgi:RNA polymerase sigma-70 factor, ECF subfamily